ncbi:MAG TPA: enolase C-terminal domain-like protein [Polyangiaceae bacterium]|nr:enolase C-terminal domain-like protein [Polyangiaceae bacterium]
MKLELRRLKVPTPRAKNARQQWPERESLLLRLSDARGRAGVGEASPLPGYSRDSLDAVEHALQRLQVGNVERALEAGAPRAVLGAVATLLPATLPSARMALETAVLDFVGHRDAKAAPALLGAPLDAERPLAELVGSPLDVAFVSSCERAIHAGFRHLKVKLGAPGRLQAELLALQSAAERFGAAARLRVDANRALSLVEVERAWTALEASDVELFEEPGALSPSLPRTLPLALDESLQGLDVPDAIKQLETTNARFAVLKPTALGGLEHCWRLAERAQAAGVRAIVSHCFDGPLALRAAAALALSLDSGVAHGLAPHAGLEGWASPAPPCAHGWLRTWSAPGLGFASGSYFE